MMSTYFFDGSRFRQARDQRCTRKPLGTYHGPGGFPYTAYLGRLVPARTMISAPPQDDPASRVQRGFSLVQRHFSLRVSPDTNRDGRTLWPRIHAVLFAYCGLITGFVLAFSGPWLAHPEQFLNILWKGDGDQSPAPLQ